MKSIRADGQQAQTLNDAMPNRPSSPRLTGKPEMVCVPVPDPDANGWYPIGCAPQDGSVVDLWTKRGFVQENACYTWNRLTHGGRQTGWTWHNGPIVDEDEFSHWRPVVKPEPPVGCKRFDDE